MKAPPRARAKVARSADRPVLGAHPALPHPFGQVLDAKDGLTVSEVPHRALVERDGLREATEYLDLSSYFSARGRKCVVVGTAYTFQAPGQPRPNDPD